MKFNSKQLIIITKYANKIKDNINPKLSNKYYQKYQKDLIYFNMKGYKFRSYVIDKIILEMINELQKEVKQ